jgi:hypothetical protein
MPENIDADRTIDTHSIEGFFRRYPMTENPTPEETTEKQAPEGSLTEEFRILGENLVATLQAAWDSPERKRFLQEIQDGLTDLGTTLKDEAESFSNSPTSQRLKDDVNGVADRIRTGEPQAKVRQELLNALHAANSELEKVISQWSSPKEDETEEPEDGPADNSSVADNSPVSELSEEEAE